MSLEQDFTLDPYMRAIIQGEALGEAQLQRSIFGEDRVEQAARNPAILGSVIGLLGKVTALCGADLETGAIKRFQTQLQPLSTEQPIDVTFNPNNFGVKFLDDEAQLALASVRGVSRSQELIKVHGLSRRLNFDTIEDVLIPRGPLRAMTQRRIYGTLPRGLWRGKEPIFFATSIPATESEVQHAMRLIDEATPMPPID